MDRHGKFVCLHDGQPHQFFYLGLRWVTASLDFISDKPNAAEWVCVRETPRGKRCGVTVVRSLESVMADKQ